MLHPFHVTLSRVGVFKSAFTDNFNGSDLHHFGASDVLVYVPMYRPHESG